MLKCLFRSIHFWAGTGLPSLKSCEACGHCTAKQNVFVRVSLFDGGVLFIFSPNCSKSYRPRLEHRQYLEVCGGTEVNLKTEKEGEAGGLTKVSMSNVVRFKWKAN